MVGNLPIRFKKIRSDAKEPTRESDGAVGFDFHLPEDVTIPPQERALLPTGLVIEVPEGHMLMLVPRSSTFKKWKLVQPHSIGIIDCDYCGDEDEVMIQVYNPTTDPVTVHRGERVAQGIFVRTAMPFFVECREEFGKTRGGFGSTG